MSVSAFTRRPIPDSVSPRSDGPRHELPIDHLRGFTPATNLLEKLLVAGEEIVGSEVIRLELLASARRDELDPLERFFGVLTWRAVDEAIARRAGYLVQRYRRALSGIDVADYIIAATAMELDARLLTTNVRHFPMITGLETA